MVEHVSSADVRRGKGKPRRVVVGGGVAAGLEVYKDKKRGEAHQAKCFL